MQMWSVDSSGSARHPPHPRKSASQATHSGLTTWHVPDQRPSCQTVAGPTGATRTVELRRGRARSAPAAAAYLHHRRRRQAHWALFPTIPAARALAKLVWDGVIPFNDAMLAQNRAPTLALIVLLLVTGSGFPARARRHLQHRRLQATVLVRTRVSLSPWAFSSSSAASACASPPASTTRMGRKWGRAVFVSRALARLQC